MEWNNPLRIVEGDNVEVTVAGGFIHGIVRYKPCDPFDCWIIESPERVYYMQQFNMISKAKGGQ